MNAVNLYSDPFFTFRFAEDRRIPRFHLEGIPVGRPVSIYAAEPDGELLGTAVVGEDGWVDLEQPLVVRAGDVFVVVAKPAPPG
jgi:hypothetical protein